MNAWILVAACAVTCPWTDAQCVPCCEPVMICVPCPTVWTVVCEPAEPTGMAEGAAPADGRPASEADEQAVVDAAVEEVVEATDGDEVTENALAEEEIVTEPAGLVFPPSFSLDSMALDWGLATIGAGTLYPTSHIAFSSALFPYFGSNDGTTLPPLVGSNGLPTIVCGVCCEGHRDEHGGQPLTPPLPPIDVGGPSTVPEPGSVAVWLTGMLVAGCGWSRRRSGTRKRPRS